MSQIFGEDSTFTVDKGPTTSYFWNRTLTFQMPRVVVIQIWQIGLLNYALQVLVFFYFITQALTPSLWSISEVPTNIINAWVEGGEAAAGWATTSSSIESAFPYCGTSEYDFTYNDEFNYTNTNCQAMHAWEVTQKLPGTTIVSTVYLDVVEEGWDCGAADAATKAAACTAAGGTLGAIFGTQCLCTTHKTTYPVGVEDMEVVFDHTVQTTTLMSRLGGTASQSGDALMQTDIVFGDGSDQHFAQGSVIRLKLSEWLRAAGIALDDLNTHVAPDPTDSAHHPFFRTTGVTIMVDVEYTNVKPLKNEPEYVFHREIRATVKPHVDEQWAGLGVKAPIYEVVPTGVAGAQTYRKLLRYSQGAVFKFTSKGFIYRVDATALMNLFTNFIVLLGLTSTVTSFVAKYLWRDRKMIRNKSEERLAVGTRLAEIAIKAVTYAATFGNLEKTGDGKVTSDDLVKVFNKAGAPFTPQEAKAMATMIICRSNDDDPSTEPLDALREMDYVEYVNGMEAGQALSVEEFRQAIKRLTTKRGKFSGSVKVLPSHPEANEAA